MSSRLSTWQDRDEADKAANLEILYDRAVSVDVYRSRSNPSNAGLDVEITDDNLQRSVNVRLDPSDRPNYDMLALVDDTDVRINDRWRYTPPTGKPVYFVVRGLELRYGTTLVRLKYV